MKSVYCHPAYLTSMQSTSFEMSGWMKHKLESRLLGEISVTSDMQMTSPLWQKIKSLLEKAMAPYSSTLAWKIPWMEEPGGLQSMGSLGLRHD